MRTKKQAVNRYFAGVWAVLALILGALIVCVYLYTGPTPDWATSALSLVWFIGGAGIGFMHGATAIHAKQLDDQEVSEVSSDEEGTYTD